MRASGPRWPWWGQFLLAFFALIFIGVLLIGLPIWSASHWGERSGAEASDVWIPMIAVLVGMTTVTVSGILLFMTFRIDRGTKLQAEWTAKAIAETIARAQVAQSVSEAKESLGRIEDKANECAYGVKKAREQVLAAGKDEVAKKVRGRRYRRASRRRCGESRHG